MKNTLYTTYKKIKIILHIKIKKLLFLYAKIHIAKISINIILKNSSDI